MVIICEVIEKTGAAGRGRAEDSMEERAPLGTCLMLRLVAWKGSKENKLHSFALGFRLLCILLRRALSDDYYVEYLIMLFKQNTQESKSQCMFSDLTIFCHYFYVPRVNQYLYAMFILFSINFTPKRYNGICVKYKEWLKNNNCINTGIKWKLMISPKNVFN